MLVHTRNIADFILVYISLNTKYFIKEKYIEIGLSLDFKRPF